MALKDYLSWESLKPIVRAFYDNTVYPAAKKYVEKTENTYDDVALKFLDDLIDDLLEDKKAE